MSEIRDYLNAVLQRWDNPLMEFLRVHGEVYPVGPHSFDVERGEMKQCYANATMLALTVPHMTYVEGKVSLDGLPIDHAWCIDETGTVVEPTLAPAIDGSGMMRVREYFGVTFRHEYLHRAMLVNGYYGLLDGFYQQRTLPKLVELGLEDGQQWLLDHPVRRRRGKLLLAAAALLASFVALQPVQAGAETRTLYGQDGRTVGREVTARDGASVLYGRDGRVETRSTTGSDGTVTTYGSDGRVILRAVPQRRP